MSVLHRKFNFIRISWGKEVHLGESFSEVSDSRFQLSSQSQGRDFKPCLRLHAGHEASLKHTKNAFSRKLMFLLGLVKMLIFVWLHKRFL